MISLLKSHIKNILFSYLISLFEIKKTSTISYQIGICSFICHKHVDMFIYNLMSLFYQLGKSLPLYVVDDGSLTPEDNKKLKKYFTVIIEPYRSSEEKISKILRGYKNIFKFRFDEEVCDLRKKLDAFFLNPFEKFMYLDADILFHNYPKEIILWLESKNDEILYTVHLPYPRDFFNFEAARVQYAYRFLLSKHLLIPVDPSFNTGFLCVPNKKSLSKLYLDKVLNQFYLHNFVCSWVSEETALSFSFNNTNLKKLSPARYVNVWADEEYLKAFTNKTISLHYSGNVKYVKFKGDAIKLAIKYNLFWLNSSVRNSYDHRIILKILKILFKRKLNNNYRFSK